MRVISQDKKINISYEDNIFAVVKDDEKESYHVALRLKEGFLRFVPLATYNNEVSAMNAFNDMIAAGEKCMIPNGTFDFK